MQAQDELGFDACTKILPVGEKLGDREEFVGHAFHGGNDDDYVGILCDGLDEFGGVQHARHRAAKCRQT